MLVYFAHNLCVHVSYSLLYCEITISKSVSLKSRSPAFSYNFHVGHTNYTHKLCSSINNSLKSFNHSSYIKIKHFSIQVFIYNRSQTVPRSIAWAINHIPLVTSIKLIFPPNWNISKLDPCNTNCWNNI